MQVTPRARASAPSSVREVGVEGLVSSGSPGITGRVGRAPEAGPPALVASGSRRPRDELGPEGLGTSRERGTWDLDPERALVWPELVGGGLACWTPVLEELGAERARRPLEDRGRAGALEAFEGLEPEGILVTETAPGLVGASCLDGAGWCLAMTEDELVAPPRLRKRRLGLLRRVSLPCLWRGEIVRGWSRRSAGARMPGTKLSSAAFQRRSKLSSRPLSSSPVPEGELITARPSNQNSLPEVGVLMHTSSWALMGALAPRGRKRELVWLI